MTSVFKISAVSDGGDNSSGSLGPDALNFCDSLAGITFLEDNLDFLVEEMDSIIETDHKLIQLLDRPPHPYRQAIRGILEH